MWLLKKMAPPRVAAICGVYRPHSHADVGIGKLLHGETLTPDPVAWLAAP